MDITTVAKLKKGDWVWVLSRFNFGNVLNTHSTGCLMRLSDVKGSVVWLFPEEEVEVEELTKYEPSLEPPDYGDPLPSVGDRVWLFSLREEGMVLREEEICFLGPRRYRVRLDGGEELWVREEDLEVLSGE